MRTMRPLSRVIYLSGHAGPEFRALASDEQLGVMNTPANGFRRIEEFQHWAADTGCFTNPDLDVEHYLRWLASYDPKGCLFATAPDVVGDPVETWARSVEVLPRIRALGLPAALVAQDGLRDPPWDAFDALFIGGSTEWKFTEAVRTMVARAG